jgi:3-vinyl bacteriochlorophyllide hydratase
VDRRGYDAATISIVIKTFVLLHHHGDRRDLGKGRVRPVSVRAAPFFWEDVFSFAVIALHLPMSGRCFTPASPTISRCGSRWRPMPPTSSMPASSCWKLRVARLEAEAARHEPPAPA